MPVIDQSPPELLHKGGDSKFARRIDCRSIHVACSPAQAFRAIQRIGGSTGWYFADWLWRSRGYLDLLLGGVGMRRGRRDHESLAVGETVDFWRVEAFEPNQLLRLFAEMKVPGRAWLQFEVEQESSGCTIRQIAIFDPAGLSGLLYWYILYPIHQVLFEGMLRGIARTAERGVIGSVRGL